MSGEIDVFSKRGRKVRDFPNFMLRYAGILQQNPYHAVENPKGIINFGVAENTLVEDLISNKLQEPKMNEHVPSTQHYFPFHGLNSFKEALAGFLTRRFHASSPIDPQNLTVTSGVGSAIDIMSYMLCDAGDACLVFSPYYAVISADVGVRAGVECISVKLHSSNQNGRLPFSINIKETEDTILKAKSEGERIKMVVIMNPHNPMGDIIPKEDLIKLLELFNKYDLHVVMDEIYGLSTLRGHTFTSILSFKDLPCPEKVHFLWGFSKDLGLSGYRCGVIHTLQPEFSAACNLLVYMGAVPALIQDRLARIITDDEWLDTDFFPENKRRMNHSLDYFQEGLRRIGAGMHEPKAGFFIWADLRKFLIEGTMKEEVRLFEELLSDGVYCVPGTAMFSEEPGWFRFTFTHPIEYLRVGLDRLERVLKRWVTLNWAKKAEKECVAGYNGINGICKYQTQQTK